MKTYLTELEGAIETEVVNQLTGESINLYSKLGISQVPNQINGRTLYQEMIGKGQDNYTKTFRYRMWIREDATDTNERGVWKYSNKAFTVRVNVYASNETIPEPIKPEQEPNEPVLVQGQIPVIYDKEKSSWVKADTGTDWYNYSNQEWANVVTVKASGTKTREEYMSAEAGTEVSMSDINTMWVWIPRYEYFIPEGTRGEKSICIFPDNHNAQYDCYKSPGEIKIKFLADKNSAASNGYRIHPAFTFGSDELEGLWYAKFETSTTDSTCNSSASTSNCDKLMTSLQAKPNVGSWRYANVSNHFNSSRNMQLLYANTYGFSTTDSDVHMSKNSEWGAVAYLSQSKYGKYGNSNYEGANKEIYQNQSTSYITGMSNGTPSSSTTNTQVTYDVEGSGTGASTTGNITGVYDMSGGATEYVMGNFNKTSVSSGFSTFPDVKYYDVYTTTNINTACNGGICFGHALSETWAWYGDYALFIQSTVPWVHRGCSSMADASVGVFGISFSIGVGYPNVSSRLVHVPLK